jgi:hypothetical protein
VEVRPNAALLTLIGGVLAAIAALFLWVFHERYWLWRHCFNDQGRCWDPASEQVFLEQAGVIWGGIAALFALGAALVFWLAWRSKS